MMFVDGENFTLRAQKVANSNSLVLLGGRYAMKDTFVWFPNVPATAELTPRHLKLQPHAIRSFYYTSVSGDDVKLNEVKTKNTGARVQPRSLREKRA
jgi:hypothetical protein